MKKLLLFLVLCTGSAGAMQSDVVHVEPVGAMADKMDQFITKLSEGASDVVNKTSAKVGNFASALAKEASKLTSEQRKQAFSQATKNVRGVAESCGDDKVLLKTTLIQHIKNLGKTIFVDNTVDVIHLCYDHKVFNFEFFVKFFEMIVAISVLHSCVGFVVNLANYFFPLFSFGVFSAAYLWLCATSQNIAPQSLLRKNVAEVAGTEASVAA